MADNKQAPFLSVVIPCYNEEKNLRRGALAEVEDYFAKQKYDWEVIISDDESTDKSLELVKKISRGKPNFFVLENKHGGKPFALRSGIEKARGQIILTTDMDQSTPIKEIEKLLPWFNRGYDIVIGSRGSKRAGFEWYRRLMSSVFRFLRGFFILGEITDTQCGFKAYKGPVIKKIFPLLDMFTRRQRAKGWTVSAFDVELLHIAQKRGYRIKEVKVEWEDRDISTSKKHDFIKESREMAIEVIRVKWNDWRGKYDRK